MPAEVRVEKTEYAGWPNCYRITNGETELVVTSDVGPRVIRYGYVGGRNLFVEFKDQLGGSGESEWKARGGHRLWIAPEVKPDTYALDNAGVAITVLSAGVTLLAPVEPETGLQKTITVQLAPGGLVTVTHKITNKGAKTRRLAAWALTQLDAGGTAFAAIPPRGTHDSVLLPTNPLTMWAYTDFSDPRWKFTTRYISLRNDPAVETPQKTGLYHEKTAAAYLLGDVLFTKRAAAPGEITDYPDFGCSFETFTNHEFLELETLGPLTSIGNEESVEHVETWTLKKNVKLDAITDEALDKLLA